MLETIAAYAFVSAILMALVQYIKKTSVARGINPLLILAGLSILGGLVYALLFGFGYWELVVAHVSVVAMAANAIYTVLSEIIKVTTGENPLRQDA